MPLEIFDCAQGSEDWYRCRLGLPTASNFDAVLAKGKGGAESATRARYMRTLAAEIITGEPGEQFTTPAMERGKAMEEEARRFYSFVHDAEPETVGFIRNGQKGCSPDALLGADGLLEIKTKRGDILIETILKDEFPGEHFWQCMGALWVCEREWIDLACFWPGLPLCVKRLHRDDKAIAALSDGVDRFNQELAGLVERVRRYGVAA